MQFWQNDWDLSLAMGVTQQWNGLLKVDLREENSLTASARAQAQVWCSATVLLPLPTHSGDSSMVRVPDL